VRYNSAVSTIRYAQDEEHRFQVETFRNLAGICDRKAFQAGECEN